MSELRDVLAGLKDVRGVEGSFVLLLPGGELVARDGLPVVTDGGLAETARRLSNLFEVADTVCPRSEEAVLRFEGMSLFARRTARVMLGVLVGEAGSLPALRMATNLALRRLEDAPLAPAAAKPAAPAETKPPTLWRGRPVGPNS
jgi:hypothetical protein